MKVYLIIICAMFSFNLAVAQKNDSQVDISKYKKVPIVTFSPIEFETILNDAFKFTVNQDYYLISKENVYSFDMRYGTEYLLGKYQDRKIHINKAPINIDKFLNIIEKNDSCFFFSFTAYQRFNNEILGIKKGEDITFYDAKGNQFDKLEDLATDIYGSVNGFYDIYLKYHKANLYFSNAAFYRTHSVDEAKNILKYDYNFIYYNNPSDTTANIHVFIDLLDSIVSLSTDKKQELTKLVETYIRDAAPQTSIERELAEIGKKQIDFIPLMGVNVNEIIKESFTSQEHMELSELLAIKRAQSNFAYSYLLKKFAGDILKEYNNIAIVSPKLKLDYILKKIIFANSTDNY